jgi:FtsP/CotA-like multicopper oxidase with cupredoxin domain
MPTDPLVADYEARRAFTGKTVTQALAAGSLRATVAAKSVTTWGYNGALTAPTLRAMAGDRLQVTLANQLKDPTSIHWHGIELQDSYVDGVAGFSGAGTHLEPEIAPADSFVAQFTPPRSGTFMYHAHMDEVREQRAGLLGALIVRDPGSAPSPDDHVFFLKGSRRGDAAHPLEINGQPDPDTAVFRFGHPSRFRILSLAWANPRPDVSVTERSDSALTEVRDTSLVMWTPVAKDGRDLPTAARTARPALQSVAIGETYDFEFTPSRRGTLHLEVRAAPPPHRLLIRVPIRVE